MKYVFFLFSLSFFLSLPFAEPAAQNTSIRALVNDEVISDYDVKARTTFVIETGGAIDRKQDRAELEEDVLETLIEEKLKLKEAEKNGVKLAQKDVDDAILGFERKKGMEKGTLRATLARLRLPPSVLENQVKADLLWHALLERQLAGTPVSDQELFLLEEKERKAADEDSYWISEIVIPYGSDRGKALKLAESLVERVNEDGDPFQALAKEHSVSPSAENGGDLGFVPQSRLDKPTLEILSALEEGSSSPPLETDGGYRLLLLRQFRKASSADLDQEVRFYSFALPPPSSPDYLLQKTALTKDTGSCQEFKETAFRLSPSQRMNEDYIPLIQISPEMREKLGTSPIEKAVPLFFHGGEFIVMVCDKRASDKKISSEQARQKAMTERMDILSARKLRELRNSAAIDIKDKGPE